MVRRITDKIMGVKVLGSLLLCLFLFLLQVWGGYKLFLFILNSVLFVLKLPICISL